MHICPLPCTLLWAKIGWASIFLKNRFQINANDLNLRVAKCNIFKIYSSSTIHPTITFNLKWISVHSHAHPLSKNCWVSIFLKNRFQIRRKWPQFESCQMYIFKIYSSSTIHRRTSFNLKCIFVHSHAHPLSKNWLSQHIPKKQIPNRRKWPQFESCQMYISKCTPHQQYSGEQPSTSNAYLSTPMLTLWAKIDWVSIFLKSRF